MRPYVAEAEADELVSAGREEIANTMLGVLTYLSLWPYQWTPLAVQFAGRRDADQVLVGVAAVFIAEDRYEYVILPFEVTTDAAGAVSEIVIGAELAVATDVADAGRLAWELARRQL